MQIRILDADTIAERYAPPDADPHGDTLADVTGSPTPDLVPPRVAVLMPVFNGHRWLAQAIESVLHQTLVDFELLVIDDGSSDGSLEIVDDYCTTDRRVRMIVNEANLGIAASLNRGWQASRAAYIARLDADDIALPRRLSDQADFLDANPSVAVVGGAAIMIDEGGRPYATLRYPTRPRAVHATLLHRNCIAHPAVMIRRAALQEVGGYRFRNVEDYDLWLRLAESYELTNLEDPVILYRQHPDQYSIRAAEDQAYAYLAVRAAAVARRSGERDPLADGREPTEIRDDPDDARITVGDHARLVAAVNLEQMGHAAEARRLVDGMVPTLGPRVWKTYAAVGELTRAEAELTLGRRLAAARHVAAAARHDAGFTASRLALWSRRRFGRNA